MSFLDSLALFLKQASLVQVALYLVAINLATFFIYRHDKRAAVYRNRRVPESTLHFLMFIGGTVGALAGQRILRHKTRKQPFQSVFWLLVLVQIIGLSYIMTV